MVKAQHATLEPCEANTDGDAVTVYFPEGTTEEQAKEWICDKGNRRSVPGNLGVYTDDPDFCAVKIKCDFPGFVCFQYHPTG